MNQAMKITLSKIIELYKIPGGESGGKAHVVFDDGNLDDENIIFCKNQCLNWIPVDKLSVFTAETLTCFGLLTEKERATVFNAFWNETEPPTEEQISRFSQMKRDHKHHGVFVVLKECEGEPNIPHNEIWILKKDPIPPFVTRKTLVASSMIPRNQRRYLKTKQSR
jgi:hypothetical protein